MAYSSGGDIQPGSDYNLGEYRFQLRYQYDSDEEVTGIVAKCIQNGETRLGGIDVDGRAIVESWSVEANDTTADVYATVKIPTGGTEYASDLDTAIPQPIPVATSAAHILGEFSETWTAPALVVYVNNNTNLVFTAAPTNPYGNFKRVSPQTPVDGPITAQGSYTYNGKTVYYGRGGINALNPRWEYVGPDPIYVSGTPGSYDAWTMIYGTPVNPEYEEKNLLIARFAIDLHDAGGTGSDSNWDDPEDYNEDPNTVLNLTVTGALSGRHSDPLINDPYSYTPADKETIKSYGCGGDGGNGGGGGAGASTVIVYRFTTDQANSKEVTAIARRHGYGSGGGKGGKGGDGCILIYY